MFGTTNLTQREEDLLRWLLNPEFFGERISGLTAEDAHEMACAIGHLQNVSRRLERQQRPEMKGVYDSDVLISAQRDALQSSLAQLQRDLSDKRTVHISKIRYRSHEGVKNDDEGRHLFFAALIARKRGPKPYEFIREFLANLFWKNIEATAIAVRVSRFEKRLQSTGLMSCIGIITSLYSEFLSHRGQESLVSIQGRLRRREIPPWKYVEECKRVMSPNAEERQWLNSLCAYAKYPSGVSPFVSDVDRTGIESATKALFSPEGSPLFSAADERASFEK